MPAHRAGAVGGRPAAASPTHALTAGESVWLALLPCGLVLVATIMALGPPVGQALFAPPADSGVWREYLTAHYVRSEPTEHARYVLALLGPLLVSGGALLLAGRQMSSRLTPLLVTLARAALVAFVVAGVAYQQVHVYGSAITGGSPERTVYLTPVTLAAAFAIALAAALALGRRDVVARLTTMARETVAKRIGATAVAALFVLVWLLSAYNTDATIRAANLDTRINVPFLIDESFAVLNGQSPLVDFHAQYGQLWAFVGAGGMALLGTSLGVYAAVMLAGTAGAMAAVFATFRRLTGTSLVALALFLPFVATSFFMEVGPPENRYGPANLFSLFPIRYGGPYLLLWLVVRRARNAGRPPARELVGLFALAGLVAINNVEFGIPAFGATLAALIWTAPSRSAPALARLAASALAGLAVAIATVSALTLAVAGSLPHFGMLSTFPRIFAVDGFGMLPMPAFGLHLVVYVTLAAALVVATVRAVSGERDAALTGALAWSGVFGLGAGAYFAGRSHPHVLIDLFSAWSLALSLLLVVVVQAIASRAPRRPALVELLVLAGFGAMVCSLAQTPTPWSQLERLDRTTSQARRGALTRVVERLAQPGEPIALVFKQGHRIAYDAGVRNVAPYANIGSMMEREQWEQTIAALQRANGRVLVLPQQLLFQEQVDWLVGAGYQPFFRDDRLGLIAVAASAP